MHKSEQYTALTLLFAAVILLLAVFANLKHLNALPPNDDGQDNLALATGLAHTGTLGKYHANQSTLVFEPSNSREPFPNWLTAKWIQTLPALNHNLTLDKTASARQLTLLKWPNLFVWALTLVGYYYLMLALLSPIVPVGLQHGIAVVTTGFCAVCMHPVFISTLLTEFHAACLLVWFLWAWLVSWQRASSRYAGVAGGLLGLLILTKAAFLYVTLALLLAVLPVMLIWRMPRMHVLQTGLLFGLALLIAASWMWRNHHVLGAWEIAGRGPNVLLTRAFKSQMTDDEFKGAFYAYAPQSLKHTFKTLTGYSAIDREKGGRLQRFTRFFDSDVECRTHGDEACAIGYYIKANIRYNNIMADYAKRYPNDARRGRVEGERAAKQIALQMIKENPWGHLRTTLVFAWRGAWPCNKVDGRWFSHEVKYLQPAWQELLPFVGLCCMLVFSVLALFRRDMQLLILSWAGTAAYLFYATASHFIPRYSEMLIPLWVVSFVYASVRVSKMYLIKKAI